jgi:hypothetical protein
MTKEITSMKRTLFISATWIVVLNALILFAHSAAHVSLHILSMTIFDDLFIGIVIMILPFVALFMIYNTHLSRQGMLLLLLSMLSSLIYGLLHHFLLPGMDNVTNAGPEPWHLLFILTSYLQLPLQAAGAMISIWALLARQQMAMLNVK